MITGLFVLSKKKPTTNLDILLRIVVGLVLFFEEFSVTN